jgi:phosphoglucosamine mutase
MKLFGSSGIRTLFNQDLLNIAFRVGLAVGRIHANVVVGRDTRTSGDVMKHAVISGLLAAGARCKDAGVLPTPTLAFITREFDTGIMITASHNPPEYNGVKLLNPDGSSYDALQQTQIEEQILKKDYTTAGWELVKNGDDYPGVIDKHISVILSCFIRGFKAKVVVDAGCAAASEVTPLLLRKFGCEVISLNCSPGGFFPRGIEPVEENLQELCRTVVKTQAAVGIAHDGDADRMMAVDEKGRFISGDKLLAILSRSMRAKDVVTTLDASMAIEEMGFNVRRTRIGDTWVSEELRKGGEFGGETSGAWIFPNISLCPDGIYAAAQIAALASECSLAELADTIPVYPLLRGNVNYKKLDMSKLKVNLTALKPVSMNDIDGYKLDFSDGWLLVRPSGTEPKIRLTAEAKNQAKVKQLYDRGLEAVQKSITTGV